MFEDPHCCAGDAECSHRAKASCTFVVRGTSARALMGAAVSAASRTFRVAPAAVRRPDMSFLGFRVAATLNNTERSQQSALAP